MSKGKVWKGRFSKETAPEMEKFSHSIETDKLLYAEDIAVNKAWAKSLSKIGVLSGKELNEILTALEKIESEFNKGSFSILPEDEDIHSAIERRLTEITGDSGKKIHTGRSRNDQVITDLLLYLKRVIPDIKDKISALEKVIVALAKDNKDLIMPGYTHLQQAQPILFSHYILSFFWLLERDKESLIFGLKHCNIMPLGAGALAGSGFPIDRKELTRELGFGQPSRNSLDITAHRDIPTFVAFVLASLVVHLSRYASDFILWATDKFDFVQIDDEYATGSSIMPQKKNPDSLELIRGKSASAIGHLTALLSLCHGLPHAYNRDLQEDKKHIFEIVKIAEESITIFTGVLKTLTLKEEKIESSLSPELLATEVADYLTERKVPFRTAHEITGKIVKWANKNNISINEVPLDKFKDFSPVFEKEIYDYLDFARAIERRNLTGGTGKKSIKEQIKKAEQILKGKNL
jgi:argininosuccinate lyase